MEYKKLEYQSYNLHLIKTDKFKTVLFKFIFRDEIKKEEITLRNVLLKMLGTSSLNFPKKRLIDIKRQDLYDLNMYFSNQRIGNHILSELNFSILDKKYINLDITLDTINFIKEIIFNPNIKNNSFDDEQLKTCLTLTKEDILRIRNYPSYYATLKLKEEMSSSNSFSFNMDGYLPDLEKINGKNLYKYYKKFLNNSLIDIYVIGDIDFNEIDKLIKDNFNFKTKKETKKTLFNNYLNQKRRIVKKSLITNNKQSNLAVGCSFNNLTDDDIKYNVVLYNSILGNSPCSRLFSNIREEKSLAYSINSSYSKNDTILVINTGIKNSNYKLVIKEIKKEMKKMTKIITDEELENAKRLIINSLTEVNDYQSSICSFYFSMDYLGRLDLTSSIKKINEVTKEDIMKVAKKIKIDTIYLLKEESYGKNKNK